MKKTIYILLFGVFVWQACDTIDESNRIIKMDKLVPQKNILVMDFTDQLCINCPEASAIIDSMQNRYGQALIAVSIHSSTSKLPLVTDEGKEYDKRFAINYNHPKAVIDGLGAYPKAQWEGVVIDRFHERSKINLELTTDYNEAARQINIRSVIDRAALSVPLKYQLWIVEDRIVDYQKINSKDYDWEYVHNHVFRQSVNGTWGENLSISNNKESLSLDHSCAVSEKWNPEHLSIVGFIYNDSSYEIYDVKQNHVSHKVTE